MEQANQPKKDKDGKSRTYMIKYLTILKIKKYFQYKKIKNKITKSAEISLSSIQFLKTVRK